MLDCAQKISTPFGSNYKKKKKGQGAVERT
jgi:hypothetical protein